MGGITLALIVGAVMVIGIALGIAVTLICTMERPWFWFVLVRIPQSLHVRLQAAADARGRKLKDEIVRRLERSLADKGDHA
jgi:hypothetical protein